MFRKKLLITSSAQCIWKEKLILGEGSVWIPNLNSIFFVDIKKKKILIFNYKTNNKKVLLVNKEIGFISQVKKDIFILGLKSELRIINLKNLKTIFSITIEPEKPNNRLNDGKVDSIGRLWFGTMDNFEKEKSGSLYCLDNYLRLHKIDDGYFITNGPAFLDSNNFYYSDSKKRVIYKIKVNNNLKILKKTIFLRFKKTDGSPDGMTTDIKNNLWLCHYGGAKISVYNLKGHKIHEVKFLAKNITNCTFGGFKNNELFITTATKGMSSREIKKYPLSGSLFKIKTNSKGKRATSFKMPNLKF